MKHSIILFILISLLTHCVKPIESEKVLDNTSILNNLADNIILPAYKDVDDKSFLLHTAILNLKNSPTEANLEVTKIALLNYDIAFETIQCFNFGPLKNNGYDAVLESCPIDIALLDSLLRIGVSIDSLSYFSGRLVGSNVIRYLILGISDKKKAIDFTARELSYLVLLSENLYLNSRKLYDTWRPGNGYGNYITNIKEAGVRGVFHSQQSCFVTLLKNSISVLDEIANHELTNPHNTQTKDLYYCNPSKEKVLTKLYTIEALYKGINKNGVGDEKGISNIILKENPTLNVKILLHFNQAIESVELIPNSFSFAVNNDKQSLENSIQKVSNLLLTYQYEVGPIIKAHL